MIVQCLTPAIKCLGLEKNGRARADGSLGYVPSILRACVAHGACKTAVGVRLCGCRYLAMSSLD